MLLTFADAAEEVLKHHSKGAPMNYREITQLAVNGQLLAPGGHTPEASMNVAIRQDIKRRDLTGRDQRFRAHGRGLYSLAMAADPLGGAIDRRNAQVRSELRTRLAELHPKLFEELIGELLSAVGYENVEVTRYAGDGGIDVRATLTVGGVTRVQTAIQVKRWARNVSGRTVRELRGALGPHERGLIITLSRFTRDAIADASAEARMPISLVDGDRLLELLIENDIGVIRRKLTVYELDEEAFAGESVPTGGQERTVESVSPVVPHFDTRARSLWPLPGGRRAWKESLDQMLMFIASEAPRLSDAVLWLKRRFKNVASEKVARSYWQVPRTFGLVQTDGEQLSLTPEGASYLKDPSPKALLQLATQNVLGFQEILGYLGERPHTQKEILERMRRDLDLAWETDAQVAWRVRWLENMEAVSCEGERWALRADASTRTTSFAKGRVRYNLDHYFTGKSLAVVQLYQALHAKLLSLNVDVVCAFKKQYIAYKAGKTTICSVIPQRRRLRLVLPLDPRSIRHPLVRDVSGIGHWGIGDLEVSFDEAGQLDQIMSWIQLTTDKERSDTGNTQR